MHTTESGTQWHAHDRIRKASAAVSASLIMCIGVLWVSSHNAPSLLSLSSSQESFLGETEISGAIASSGNRGGQQPLVHLRSDAMQASPSLTQALTGWEKERNALDGLIKKAEKRLKKDVKADDPDEGARGEKAFNHSISSGARNGGEDAEERLPEDSIRAEAAAMGYASVSAWRKANEHPFDIKFHSRKQEKKKAVPEKRPPIRKPALHRPENVLGKLGHWLTSFFKSDGEQQLLAASPRAYAEDERRNVQARKIDAEDGALRSREWEHADSG
eukprot:CAMPEP_0181295762 /NCGR_PEP_ID=MMETSP1101-20121128/4323_1 /TAXON_ID=46948 /ORGANISM="Rhodomonas abbreviata, Strain Caron Lab Isolate" /LENGTH=273 /DNA_ID=CAMNT_0023400541 /DNA_START=165 /DNA_END=983 /DNA_ORIENTATION=+